MPEHVCHIAEQAAMLSGPSAELLIITAAWTGCRWGELAGLQRDHIDLARGVLVIDPDYRALHESSAPTGCGSDHPRHPPPPAPSPSRPS
jgi:hypothetical protein